MITTFILIIVFVLSVLWVLWTRYNERVRDNTEIGAWIALVLCFVVLVANFICLQTEPLSTRSDIKEFEAFKVTVQQQRSDTLSSYERVQLTQMIIKENQWLAREQFGATNSWVNWYYDKSILKVEPIK